MKRILFFASVFSFANCFSQSSQLDKIRSFRTANEKNIINEFFSFLSIPNVATDTVNIGRNAAFLVQSMQTKGISNIQLLLADDSKVPPVVYGEMNVKGATKTVVFYAHYDGQPVNASLWYEGLDPFQPQLVSGRMDERGSIQTVSENFPLNENWRIYARGSSDDKGGVMAILNAFDAVKNSEGKFQFNIKFFFEGEEEQGSTHLHQIVEKYKSLLQSDLWIICDGPVHQSGYKQIVFGARGDTHLTLKVYGPKNPLHSGHYGNWVPNPVMVLAKLLAGMKDDKGMVTIKNFYNDVIPLNATEKKALSKIPDMDAALRKKIGFSSEEMTGKKLDEAINLPSLNINGIESSNVGTISANVIPIYARAVIDLRLVPGNDWKRQQQKVLDHIAAQGFFITGQEPTDEERNKYPKIIQVKRDEGENAQRTSMDWPVAKIVAAAVQQTIKDPVLQIPSMGGTLPLDVLQKVLGAKPLVIPIANYDNNQHAENENIKIKNFWEGIDIMASLMLMKL